MKRPQGIVVIGVSLGEESAAIARAGLEMSRALGRRPELVHAFTPLRHLLRVQGQGSDLQSWSETHERLRRRLHDLAASLEVEVASLGWHVEDGRPFEVLNEVASSLDADLIVVGASERDRVAHIGATADRLLRTATRPILVVRPGWVVPPKRVLFALDLSPHSAEAYRAGQLLLDQLETAVEIEVVMVLDPAEIQEPLSDSQLEDFVAAELRGVVSHFGKRDPSGVRVTVRRGDPKEEILDEVEERGFDLLVTGTHGRTGVQRLLVGSVATDLVRRAPCSLLVVPPSAAHLATTTLDAPAVESLAHRP